MNKLLEQAIKQYSIPPWPYEASYDRVIVFSVPEDKAARKTFIEGGVVEKIDARNVYEQEETPRGIVVSAGLKAKDVMFSHGMGLGHMVWVARLSPWRHQVDRDANGKDIEFLFLRVGDIVGSETLKEFLRKGHVTEDMTEEGQHKFVCNGVAIPRFDPPSWVDG